jgi:hypothetical protein
MTTRISEALRAVAEATAAPAQDRLEFQRLVRAERRRRVAGRAGIAVAAAAVVAAVVASVLPFVHDGSDEAVPAGTPGRVDLQPPVFVVVDGYLNAVDPNGDTHDLGERAEDVLGSTSRGAYVVGGDSEVFRYVAPPGPGWQFGRGPTAVADVVQSAQLSADGRYLGWVDLQERVHVRDLTTGTTADPVRARGSGYLADLASRTGTALVVDDRGLVLHRPGGAEVVLTGDSWDATIAGDRVAIPDPARTGTMVYRIRPDRGIKAVFDAPGTGRLSPLGDLVASVSDDEGDADSTVWLTAPGDEPRRLAVTGRPEAVGWADEDTVLVTTRVDGHAALYGCETTDPTGTCAPLGLTGGQIDLAR